MLQHKEFEGYRVLVAEDEEITREVTAALVEELARSARRSAMARRS